MNERIFELAKLANIIQWDSLPSGAITPDHESVVKAAKFAELIIQECLEIVEKQFGGGNGDGVEWDRAIDFTYADMLKHFEIEE